MDIFWSPEDHAFLARVPELDNCTTHGDTRAEAAQMAEEAIALYVESLEERGLDIPRPFAEQKFSGKIPLRIDPILHRDLVLKARQSGAKSLNQFLEQALKKTI